MDRNQEQCAIEKYNFDNTVILWWSDTEDYLLPAILHGASSSALLLGYMDLYHELAFLIKVHEVDYE